MDIKIFDLNDRKDNYLAIMKEWPKKVINLIDPDWDVMTRIIKQGDKVWIHVVNEEKGKIYFIRKYKGEWEIVEKYQYYLDYNESDSPLHMFIENDIDNVIKGSVRIEYTKPNKEGLQEVNRQTFLLINDKTVKVYDYNSHSYTLN